MSAWLSVTTTQYDVGIALHSIDGFRLWTHLHVWCKMWLDRFFLPVDVDLPQ